jgi:hypothetical protein
VGFNILNPKERFVSYKVFLIVLEVMYIGFSGDDRIYVGCLRKDAYT